MLNRRAVLIVEWLGVFLLVSLLSVFVAVPLMTVFDRHTVANHDELSAVRFGAPFDWVTQDQSAYEPDGYPHKAAPVDPMEHFTDSDWSGLLLNAGAVGGTVTLAIFVGGAAWERSSRVRRIRSR